MVLGLSLAAWGKIGLLLDLLAFILLSYDLIKAMENERQARDDILALERAAFNARYAVWAPNAAVQREQEEDFTTKQDAKRQRTDRNMSKRRVLAYIAILLAFVGLVLQVISGWYQ